MRLKDAFAAARPIAAYAQWTPEKKCRECHAAAPEHLRSCKLATMLEATATESDCPVCFGFNHAQYCPKG